MAEKTLNTRIVLRNDTATNWNLHNPTLLAGEAGYEVDTQKLKFGDGTTAWNDLPYFGEAAESLAKVYQTEINKGSDHQEAITSIVDDAELHNGDIAIVKELISDDKREYTAYVYNGTAWVAMDGNYDADNVYFDKDLVFTEAFGKFAPDSTGSVSIPTATNGLSLKALLEQAFAEEKNPTVTQPSTSITLTGAGAKEVGSTFTPTYSVGFNKGKYQYGPTDTGVTVTGYAVTDTLSNNATTQTGSFTQFTVADDTNYKVSVTTSYGDGAIPKTNLGNDYTAGQIKAGSKTASSGTVTGYRNEFYGTMTTKPVTMTSADIRNLTGKEAQATGNITVSIPVGALRVVVAVPNTKVINSVLDVNGLNAQIFSSFTHTTVDVEGANGFTAKTYNVYYLDYANANDTANKYTVTIANA